MEIYLHKRGGEVKFVQIEGSSTVSDFISAHDGSDAEAWLEGAEEPLDRDRTLESVGVGERSHVHVSTCKQISVRVRYDDSKTRTFSPAATIRAVFEWATGPQGFELTAAEKAKHALGICDTTTEADNADHVGTFANEDCTACFDLAPKERFEGAV